MLLFCPAGLQVINKMLLFGPARLQVINKMLLFGPAGLQVINQMLLLRTEKKLTAKYMCKDHYILSFLSALYPVQSMCWVLKILK